MVGTETSGNRTKGNRNNISLFCNQQELDFIRSLPHPNGVDHYQLIMREFLENRKKEFIEFWNKKGMDGKEIYNERIRIRSMNATDRSIEDAKKEAKKSLSRDNETEEPDGCSRCGEKLIPRPDFKMMFCNKECGFTRAMNEDEKEKYFKPFHQKMLKKQKEAKKSKKVKSHKA